ncbi:MAG TPA: molybdopterin cofactor-binding domain-containing protein, partial [Isosphaeraceae bacterium]|nr:molybdopterin cofactor-binding domain-containing protein [Isosphaeraceae bacterium]
MNTTQRDEPLVIEPERFELREGPAYHFELDRRDFLMVLGAGLIVLHLIDDADAQEAGGNRRQGAGRGTPQEIGAWIHIGEDGAITAYTGKAEVGQNIRTSLSQAVAEELRVPLASVKMVMADTALTPYDMGTFGSRTTPQMGRQLHRVAAAAREQLIDLAAESWKVDRVTLEVAEGKVRRKDSNESIAFGALTKGQKITKVVASEPPTTPAASWTIAGHDASKPNGRDLVTGRHKYASDVKLPGMWHGKVFRPPAFGAKLVSLDAKAAESMPHVVVVHDGDFIGVAAPSEPEAVRALKALKAEWNVPPAEVSSKNLHEHIRQTRRDSTPGGAPRRGGSVEDALKSADVRLEATYTVPYIAHVPMETRAAVARWDGDKLTAWTGTQRPFGVRSELAGAFKIPEDRVRVIVPDTGAGYGGKHTGEAAIEAARLAKAAGRPVKLVWTREEEFTWAYARPAGVIDVSAAARKDGSLVAWKHLNLGSGNSGVGTYYDVPNPQAEYHPAASPLRGGSYRALASTANHFARETHMDELAHALGLDPLAFRLKNLKDARLRAVLEAAAKAFGWGAKPPEGRGFGLAVGTEKGGYIATCAEVAVDRDTGKVQVTRAVAAMDCGAIVNPDGLRAQVEGCLIMGLGGALFEAIEFENGKL